MAQFKRPGTSPASLNASGLDGPRQSSGRPQIIRPQSQSSGRPQSQPKQSSRPNSRQTYNRKGALQPSIPIPVPLRKGAVEKEVIPESRGLTWLLESFGIEDIKLLPPPILRLLGAGLRAWDGIAPPGAHKGALRVGVDGVYEVPSDVPNPNTLERGQITEATSYHIPEADRLVMDDTGALYEEMETAVRPDLRVSTNSRWVTFKDMAFLFPNEMDLTQDVRATFSYNGSSTTAPETGAALALGELLTQLSTPVRGTNITETPVITWSAPVARMRFRDKPSASNLCPRAAAHCDLAVEEVILGAKVEIAIEQFAPPMRKSDRDKVLDKLRAASNRAIASHRIRVGSVASMSTMTSPTEGGDPGSPSPSSSSTRFGSPTRKRMKDRWVASQSESGGMKIPGKGFYLHLRVHGGPLMDTRRLQQSTFTQLCEYLQFWQEKMFEHPETWRVLTVKPVDVRPLRRLVQPPIFVPLSMDLERPTFAKIATDPAAALPEVPPPSHVAKWRAVERKKPETSDGTWRAVACVTVLCIGLSPTETLMELLLAPQPSMAEVGSRRLKNPGDVASPFTRAAEVSSRHELIVPPDMVGSEVKDFGFIPSVIAQNPDVLFNQATQFRLRSQIVAELTAILSLPADQIQLGRVQYVSGKESPSYFGPGMVPNAVLVEVSFLHPKVVAARSVDKQRESRRFMGPPASKSVDSKLFNDKSLSLPSLSGQRVVVRDGDVSPTKGSRDELREDLGSQPGSPSRLRPTGSQPSSPTRPLSRSREHGPNVTESGNAPRVGKKAKIRLAISGSDSSAKYLYESNVIQTPTAESEQRITFQEAAPTISGDSKRDAMKKQIRNLEGAQTQYTEDKDRATGALQAMTGRSLTKTSKENLAPNESDPSASTDSMTATNESLKSTRASFLGGTGGVGGFKGWQKAVAVTNLASDPEQVYVRLEKLLNGEQGAGGIQISKKGHLFPMLSRAAPVKEGDARGLHFRGSIICEKKDLARTMAGLESYSSAAKQQMRDNEAERIRLDSKGVADIIWQEVTAPADMWEESKSIAEVVAKLRGNKKRADICAKGIKALCDACLEDPLNRDEVRLRGGIDVIMESMQLHGTHIAVQEQGVSALAELMAGENDDNVRAIVSGLGISLLVQTMETFPQVEIVHEQGNRAFNLMHERPLEQKMITQLFTRFVQTHTNGNMAHPVFRDGALDIVRNPSALSRCLLKVIVKSGRQLWSSKERTVGFAISAIAAVCQTALDVECVLEACGIDFVTEGMNRHRDTIEVQMAGCRAFRSITQHSNSRVMYSVRKVGGIAAVTQAMVRYPENSVIQEYGAHAISCFVQSPPCINTVFETEGVLSMVRALARHRVNYELQESCVRALGDITLRVGANALFRHDPVGPVHEVLMAMIAHVQNAGVQAAGMRALDGLCPFGAEVLRQLGGVEKIVPPMFWRQKDDNVKLSETAERLSLSDDLETWNVEVYPISVRDVSGWTELWEEKASGDAVAVIMDRLEKSLLSRDWFSAHALGTILCYLAWHHPEYATLMLQMEDLENDPLTILTFGAFQIANKTSCRIAVRTLGHLLRGPSGASVVSDLLEREEGSNLDAVLRMVGSPDPALRRSAMVVCARLAEASAEGMNYLLKDGIKTEFWKTVRQGLLHEEKYVRKATGAFLRAIIPKCMELSDFIADDWHDDIVAFVADTDGEYRLPGVLLLGTLAEMESLWQKLEDGMAHVALKFVLRDATSAYLRAAAAQALTPFAKFMPDVLIEEKIVAIALRLALQEVDADSELYRVLVSFFVAVVEECKSVKLLVSLCAVKVRTALGAKGLSKRLTKRLVYRLEFLILNQIGDKNELSRYDLSRVLPSSGDSSAEAVDVKACIERLFALCPTFRQSIQM
jgi:hypothetical protein